jgi:hypothetical protein
MNGRFSTGRASEFSLQVFWLRDTTLSFAALRPTTTPLVLTCHTQVLRSIDPDASVQHYVLDGLAVIKSHHFYMCQSRSVNATCFRCSFHPQRGWKE